MKYLLTTFMLWAALAQAQNQPIMIDEIVALVEDDMITRNELIREVSRIQREFRSQGRNLPASASLNRQVLELMITQSILVQYAQQRGVVITDTQLNTAMQNLARTNNMTLAQFRQALIDSDVDYNQFRNSVKRELTINSIRNSYARQNVDITEQEVDDFLKRSGSDSETIEYKISHILIALPDAASSDQVNEARSRARELVQQLDQGADFADMASAFSDGGNALQGGDLGWRKLAQTPSLFADLVTAMAVGAHSQPLRSASGYHIIRLDAKRDSDQVLVQQTKARHILIKTDELTTDAMARQQLEDLRQRIINGVDFAELAKQYSDDPGSKGLGGDLGWFAPGMMVAEFQQVADASQIGEISDVFRSQYGWHILQVLDRRVEDETAESKRNKIRQQLQEQKKTEVLDLWQRRLRDQAFVKIHGLDNSQ
ncbi:MAG: peptidylprolyl isomerase [Gammaproteobacteria bacterium]|nr:peptidylprolyl isomerase [Gammaproteobacteria bacterium]